MLIRRVSGLLTVGAPKQPRARFKLIQHFQRANATIQSIQRTRTTAPKFKKNFA